MDQHLDRIKKRKVTVEILADTHMLHDNRKHRRGICDGTTGYILEIKKEKGKETYIISVLTKTNKKLILQVYYQMI